MRLPSPVFILRLGAAAVCLAEPGPLTLAGTPRVVSALPSGPVVSRPSAVAPGALEAADAASRQTVTADNQPVGSNLSYVATSDETTTFTLPAAPKVGDIFRVAGLGAGGWRIGQNPGQFITTHNLGLPAGITWTQRDRSRVWHSVASSADGLKLVATAAPGLYTSTDAGATWVLREGTHSYSAATNSADGTKLAVTSSCGWIYTSTDSGASWAPRDSARSWRGIAGSADGTKLIAAVDGGTLFRSSDSGATWTATESARNWVAVASSADGNKLVASVAAGRIYTSVDAGLTWTPREMDRHWRSVASSADGVFLVAADDGTFLYTSADSGATWTPRLTDRKRPWQAVATSADGSELVACVFQCGGEGRVFASSDYGATWLRRGPSKNWRGLAMSADGHRFVAVGLENGTKGSLFTSAASTTPGLTGFLCGGIGDSIELQYVGAGHWLPVSRLGDIQAH